MNARLSDLVAETLDRPVPPQARAMARELATEGGGSVMAVLFYGSCLRDQTAEGVLDFYILVDSYRGYHDSRLGAAANAALPPTVRYRHGEAARAKIAIISAGDFAARMRPDSADTTLWARFCQPAALLHARDPDAGRQVVAAISDAIATGAVWASRLGPDGGTPAQLWTALFQHTYGAELRVEDGGDRSRSIYRQAEAHFDAMLTPALQHAAERQGQKGWRPASADQYRRAWRRRRVLGKGLNIARLIKAAFTFDQRVEYIEWKVQRHTGQALQLTDFQRRHPLIAAPGVLWKLWRAGAIR